MSLSFANYAGKTILSPELENPLNCISINKDCTKVVTAGRSIFKIFALENDSSEFVDYLNLRVGRNLNLSFSACDVTWNQIEENLLASAATNGMVVTWDLNKSSRCKQSATYTEHERTVNRVCFHNNEHYLLLSGSQDGFMKLFDLRKGQGVVQKFGRKNDSVKDVKFSPHNPYSFASAHENGHIQVWDYRSPSRCEKQFPAHSGPVFSLDWHPEDRGWLATAGRDFIEVWDMHHSQYGQSLFTVRTFTAVSHVKWRPQRPHQLASCSNLLDCNVNVWDVRRPYIPFAMFAEHKNTVTGIVWKNKDCFYSSGKDCRLIQHVFRDAQRPADNANPVALDLCLNGLVAHAASDKLTDNSLTASPKFPSFFTNKKSDRTEQFTAASSVLMEYRQPTENQILSMDYFEHSARDYRLSGPLTDVCDHNAKVATGLQRPQVAQTWRIIKLLYGTGNTTPSTQISLSSKSESYRESDTERGGQKLVQSDSLLPRPDDTVDDSSEVDEESEVDGVHLSTIASGGAGALASSDYFLGDGDDTNMSFDYENLHGLSEPQDWCLPNEAIELRQDIQYKPSAISGSKEATPGRQSHRRADIRDTLPNGIALRPYDESNIKRELLSAIPFSQTLAGSPWVHHRLLSEMLRDYAEQGDVQTATCALIVLGDKMDDEIDEIHQEQWFMSYIDMLVQFRMWTAAAHVIKLSRLPAVRALAQQSTSLHLSCARCRKPLTRVGWHCDRCAGVALHTCAICRLPVKGLYVWCQGCAHGGHPQHMETWFSARRDCPTGCGHVCEYL